MYLFGGCLANLKAEFLRAEGIETGTFAPRKHWDRHLFVNLFGVLRRLMEGRCKASAYGL